MSANLIPATLIPGDGIGTEITAATLEVLDALGARSRQLSGALLAELAALGALAGLLAGIAASLIGWGLARFAFRLDYLPQPQLWLIGMAVGVVLVVGAGWLGAAAMLRQSALPALRAAQ
jgi:putative ABC transport system permease protein